MLVRLTFNALKYHKELLRNSQFSVPPHRCQLGLQIRVIKRMNMWIFYYFEKFLKLYLNLILLEFEEIYQILVRLQIS